MGRKSAAKAARRSGAPLAETVGATTPTADAGPPPDRRVAAVAAAAIVLLALWAYWPAFDAGWIWDDDLFVTNNAYVKSPNGLWDIWFGFYRDASKGGALLVKTYQYYPLVYTSFWVDHGLFGLAPAGYHVLNVCLHLVNCVLVFRLARRLAIPGAAFVAALFAVHPMMVESVVWVSERKNVLSGLFYLSAFLAYLRFDDEKAPRWFVASFLLFVGALLAKTVTATLPCALLLAVFWRHGRIRGRDVAYVVPFLVVGVVLGWYSAYLERYAVGAYRPEFGETAFERWLLIAPRAFWFYATKVVWPHPITFIYPRFDPHAGDVLAFSWLALSLLVAAALWLARGVVGPGPLLLVLFSACALAPALGFVPVFPHRYSWVADHFAYLGVLGFFALIASASTWATRRLFAAPAGRRALAGAAALCLVGCAALSHRAARSYRNEETLWRDTLAESPDAWIAMINLGVEYMTKTPRNEEQFAEAFVLFQRAERYDLGRVQALTNQGVWHRRERDYEAAAADLRRALALEPGRVRTRQYLRDLRVEQARVALAAGRMDDARAACSAGLAEIGPEQQLVQLCARAR